MATCEIEGRDRGSAINSPMLDSIRRLIGIYL